MRKWMKRLFQAKRGASSRILLLILVLLLLLPILAGNPSVRVLLFCLVPDVNFWHGYMTYAGTIMLAFVALFVTKWQDVISNRKELSIVWNHVHNSPNNEMSWCSVYSTKGLLDFNFIMLKLINVGNRKISIERAEIEIPNMGLLISLSMSAFPSTAYDKSNVNFIRMIEIEEVTCLYLPVEYLYEQFCFYIHQGKLAESDTIVITVADSTGQLHSQDTTIACGLYLEHFRKFQPDKAKEIWEHITALPRYMSSTK